MRKTLEPADITVIVDSREQTPWDLAPLQMERGSLQTGDYALKGGEAWTAIERKSLPDLMGCIGGERERFEREMQRMLAYETRAVIVEGSWRDIESGNYRAKVSPAAAIGSLLGWIAQGVPVIMAGDRERAQKFAGRLLFIAARRRFRELQAFGGSLRIASSETPASGT